MMEQRNEICFDGPITHESLKVLREEAEKLLEELEKKEQAPPPDKKAV